MFLANSDFRKGYGNTGPVLTWLNLESKREVDDCIDYGAQVTRKVSPRQSLSPGVCTSSPRQIWMATCFVFSMTSPLRSTPLVSKSAMRSVDA